MSIPAVLQQKSVTARMPLLEGLQMNFWGEEKHDFADSRIQERTFTLHADKLQHWDGLCKRLSDASTFRLLGPRTVKIDHRKATPYRIGLQSFMGAF